MRSNWHELMRLVGGQAFRIERVRVRRTDIAIEGDFAPPPLALLSADDQAFVAAFVAGHGSIKKMEALFGISYPTVKNRLNSIASQLDVPRVEVGGNRSNDEQRLVLERLDGGEITFEEAMEALK